MNKLIMQGRKTPARVPAIVAGGLTASFVSIALFGKISDEVLEHESMAFDTRLVEAARETRSPTLDRVMSAITATVYRRAVGALPGNRTCGCSVAQAKPAS